MEPVIEFYAEESHVLRSGYPPEACLKAASDPLMKIILSEMNDIQDLYTYLFIN